MKPDSAPQATFLKDYRAPSHWIDSVELRFDLHDDRAQVTNVMKIRRNLADGLGGPLILDGEDIALVAVKLDGRLLTAEKDYIATDKNLTIHSTADAFELETITTCEPQKNLALEGLYKSNGMFCTQCEAQGFRRITYFLDRPDVMSKYRVAIEADRSRYPILLSNGNLVSQSQLAGGRHEAVWDDPFKKPCYLFAMVAGDLGCTEDRFVRRSGRPVALRIFCEKGAESRCGHAMDSLKKAMKWDEDVFGLEYDLDIFMIVVVSDFNMGAMENKGLNIFNAHYVLANPQTATDSDYDGILAVVGHEYFHNWTGNRVTCRDWFQLSLKEGLTVFRDQQFSSDMGSRSVVRIEDAIKLRSVQFTEDSGPMAHPVRPQSYISINNFYTATVYEKGAEVVRMIMTIIGPAAFRRGIDKYFELFDGQAVATEDFVHAMEIASGVDLTQFKNWYDQAGTPKVSAQIEWADSGCRLTLTQSCPPTPGQPSKKPFHIPIAVGFLGVDGKDLISSELLQLRDAKQTFFIEVDSSTAARPVPSFLRGFSAPIRFEYDYSDSDLGFLMAHDSDSFARWEAAQILATRELLRMIGHKLEHQPVASTASAGAAAPKPAIIDAFADILQTALPGTALSADPAFTALLLYLPNEQFLAQQLAVVDPEAVHEAREAFLLAIAQQARPQIKELYLSLCAAAGAGGRGDRLAVGGRALKNTCLDLLCALGDPEFGKLALQQMRTAKNMTDEIGALSALVRRALPERDTALHEFYLKWKSEPLVMNKWLGLQASAPARDTLARIKRLSTDPVFDRSNPNKIYSLFGAFAQGNPARFHSADGSGYAFISDQVLEIAPRNPQVAARLMSSFNQWRRFDPSRQALMKREIARVLAQPGLASDIFEIASKALAE